MRLLRVTLFLSLVSVSSCGAPAPVHVEGLRPECEGLDLDQGGCLLPWPSSRFLVDDATTETGRRIDLSMAATPINRFGDPLSPATWNARDGFSAMTSMLVRIDGQIDDGPLASWREVADSLGDDSPTVLLDTSVDPPVRVAHFAEVQTGEGVDPAFTTLYVRPAERLQEDHHYVVAIRGLRHRDGSRPRSSITFAALRDGTTTDSAQIEARRPNFERDVFAPLTAARVARADLIIAWDFRTASGSSAWGDLVAMRDDAVARVDAMTCTIDGPAVASTRNPTTRIVEGGYEMPWFLEAACPAGTSAFELPTDALTRDASGMPTSGTRICRARFRAILPSTLGAAGSAPLVEYGHGLTYDRDEIDTAGVVAPVLEATHSIGLATDALGLSSSGEDLLAILDGLHDLSTFDVVEHRVMQGIIAQLILPRVFANACAAQIPELQVGGASVVDPTRVRWIGNSQGGILGTTVVALAPQAWRFDRAVFGVGGISYPIILPRACDWPTTLEPQLAYDTHLERDLLMVMFASHWDFFEAATFAPHLTGVLPPLAGSATTLPGVLSQTGVSDLGIAEVAGQMAARTMDLPVLSGSATMPYGLVAAPAGALTGYVSFAYADAVAPPDGPTISESLCMEAGGDSARDPNERVRRDPRAQAQIVALFDAATIP